ncbi:unnamed protein product [Microthlaspi erraticum]|uniref:Lon proteolytic domain-containing protein n=1 Tax=Microthlaspi erraticum TaxID=1685480 RepID=A0A6D2HMP1_9BRAS|nr:unnamed protein product [Microthlaspi erraticum]
MAMETEPQFVPAVNPSSEYHLTKVIALPLMEKPLCPGFYFPTHVRDPKLLADLLENQYVGVFLLKDDTNPPPETLLKGKELLNRLHEIGSLAYISSIKGHQVIHITGLTRIRITEMVEEAPLTVKIDYLKNKPYDMDDGVIKDTFLEVSSVLRDVLKTSPVWRNHRLGDFMYPYLADFGSAMPCGTKHQAQQVLQELDVHKRLQLTLQLARKEMEIIKNESLGMERNHCVFSFLLPEVDEREPVLYEQTPVGVAMALSLTSTGGSTLYMETSLVEEGEAIGCLYLMGEVGEETNESANVAYIVAKKILLKKQPENTFFANSMLRLDLPRCNGRSAGCTMTTSLLSLAIKKPVRKNLAMTGTVTPSGKVLGIGGVKEKTIGARQSQVKTIIFPEANRRDFDQLPENVKEGLHVHFVDEYEQIFELAFGYDEEDYQIELRAEGDEYNLASYVGKPVLYEQTHVGVAMCLAMTSIGGLALYVKTNFDEEDEGDGCIHIIGSLGKEMTESVWMSNDLAIQILRKKNPENTFFADSLLSIYLPACSTSNDTSACSTIVTSLLSLAMNKPVRKDLAMSGTVTPNGKILGIGNVKEKTIGARRSQVKTIIFPEANRRDFDQLPENVKEGLHVHFVDEYEQIFDLAFGYDH